ncbi:MAG: 50S ribosomal protein L13 [Bacteroidaceae bacterium]|nr:50S ribosomal protein L13 [Bacteroidaceae bacterium]
MKTFLPKEAEIERKWYVVDATNLVLGRLATKIAMRLRGKDKPIFTPHLDCGDFVVVINAEKVALTGRKATDKTYENYSGHMSGRKVQTADVVLEKNPTRVIRDAVWGMMPKGRLARAQFSKLKVYAGPEHPHTAQKCEKWDIELS